MKIQLSSHEVVTIVTKFLVEKNGLYVEGDFTFDWKIAAATGQPSKLIGAEVTIEKKNP